MLGGGRAGEAVACFQEAIGLWPENAEMHSNLGYALNRSGHLQEAVAALRAAIALDPREPRAYFNLGEALSGLGRMEEAAGCYGAVAAPCPQVPEAHCGLGFALCELDRLEEAAAALRRAIALRPAYPQAYNNLGLVLAKRQELDAAADCYRTALGLLPAFPVAWNNLGAVLDEQGRMDEAAACYRQAVGADPDCAEAHANLGMALLATGRPEEGWAEYEWRWRTPWMLRHARDFGRPRWDGRPIPGGTLLVHAEQGLGDTIQFCRFAPLAAERGVRVVMEVPAALLRLARTLEGVDGVVACGSPLPAFDAHIPMMSLPGVLGAYVPDGSPYLRADPAQASAWRAALRAAGGGAPRVGLVWAGNPHSGAPQWAATDRKRSLPPELLAPLLAVEGIRFVSLQKSGPPVPAGAATDAMAGMADFADTAALVANLDLVVSVDTAVAHLAGAMGKPVWLLNRFDSCWRWGRHGDRSDWYSSLTQYRQPRAGDWDSVLAAVAGDLRELVAR